MAMTCTICRHPEREAIDRAIVDGVTLRHIASRFGVGYKAVQRHKDHVIAEVVQAHNAETLFNREALAARIIRLCEHTDTTLRLTDAPDTSIQDRCTAGREVRGNLTLIAKIAGEIQTAPTVNIIQSPEWMQVQTVILQALAPYPDARIAVADALELAEP